MFAKDYRKLAWGKLQGKWGTAILVSLIISVISGIAAGTGIGSLLLWGFLMVGSASFFLALVRDDNPRLENAFDGLHGNLGSTLIAGLLYNIFIMLWTMLFFVPGLVKSYSYAMTFHILKDNPEMSGKDAITKSREMMNGNKWRLFCLDFSFIGWYLLCVVTCGIAALWVAPYMSAAHAAFYESLKGTDAPAADAAEAAEAAE